MLSKLFFSFLVFLFSLFFVRGVWASAPSQNFCFDSDSYIFNSQDELEVTIFSNAPLDRDFVVRPVFSEGESWILDEISGGWVASTENWDLMPNLTSSTKIKALNILDKVSLYFLLKEVGSGRVYKTCIKKVWSQKNHFEYLRKLNVNILKESVESSSTEVLSIESEKDDTSQNLQRSVEISGPSLNKQSFFVCTAVFFATFLLGLFLPEKRILGLWKLVKKPHKV